mmetsp:Transcript_2512/g.4319  ORF Transcript_2512/g.4319 Transcript_2512/m.4319 type:complete len:362 (+) Transcript_2512:1830-2915(+)
MNPSWFKFVRAGLSSVSHVFRVDVGVHVGVRVGMAGLPVHVRCGIGEHQFEYVTVSVPERLGFPRVEHVQPAASTIAGGIAREEVTIAVPCDDGQVGRLVRRALGDDEVRVAVPERFCSITVDSAGGNIEVESVREGTLRVDSGGGHVVLGSLKSGTLFVTSRGGDLRARTVLASTEVDTSGGSIMVKHLQGDRVVMRSGGGNIEASSVFAASLFLNAGDRGSVDLKGLHIKANARIAGGPIRIAGVDGSVEIASTAGDVVLHLNRHARRIEILGHGDLICSLPPALSARGVFRCAGMQVEPPLVIHSYENGLHSIESLGLGDSGQRNECHLDVNLVGQGNAIFTQRSWIENVLTLRSDPH